MQNREAEALVETLLEAFPLVQVREGTRDAYVRWLRDLDRSGTSAAIDALIMSSTTLPSIAEIRRLVLEAQHRVPTATEAWVSVNERGAELHTLTREVVLTFGGGYNIRTSDEPRIMRAQFLKTYEEFRERHLRALNATSYRSTQAETEHEGQRAA